MRTGEKVDLLHKAFKLNIMHKHLLGNTEENTIEFLEIISEFVEFVGGRSNWKLYPYINKMKLQARKYVLDNLEGGKGLDRSALFTYLYGKVEYSFREYLSKRIKGRNYERAMKVIL